MTRWQVFAAVALRRLPEVMPAKDKIELKVQEIFNAYEVARSKFSEFELQNIEDIRINSNPDADTIVKETAQDKLDQWLKERSKFEFAKHDERLSKIQYLFMKQKFGTDIKPQWLLPQAIFDANLDEHLQNTARRALKECLNIHNGFRIVSRIPSSVYSFRYPRKVVELTNGHIGAKVFFLKANLDQPSPLVLDAIDEIKNGKKLKFLTNDEAFKIVNKKYMISFSQGLLHEKRVNTDRVLDRAAKYAIALRAAEEANSEQILKQQQQ